MKRLCIAIHIVVSIVYVLIFTLPIYAQTNVKDGFEYSIENNAITITGWKGRSVDITIPETIENLPVKIISYSAFEDKHIRDIVFPECLTHIYAQAFANNQIERIIIPKNLIEIGGDAFYGNPVLTVEISQQLNIKEYIGGIPGAFSAFYILHNCQNGIYTYKDGIWYLDGKSPPLHTAIIGRNYAYIRNIDGNNSGNYIEQLMGTIGSGTGFKYLLPPGRHDIVLYYDGPKFRSNSGMKYTVNLDAGKTYSATAIIKEADYTLFYTITEE
jgi:hypothetical protein